MSENSSTAAYHQGLERLLRQQLGRIRQRFLLHGLGAWLATAALAIALYYLLDRYLRLPAGVRIVLSLGLAVYLGYLVQRFLLYPIRRHLSRRDVALAIEEKFPELRQKLISAIQLGTASTGDAELRNQSRAMIDKVIADASEHAGRIPHRELLNPKNTVKVWGIAAVLLGVVGGFAVVNLDVASVFARRALGLSAEYPRETYLFIEQPAPAEAGSEAKTNPEYRVERQDGVVKVILAAGGDLPVLVRIEGTVPREVDLQITGGRGLPPTVAMAARSEQFFKYTFRRIGTGFSFFPTGGDDISGEQRVEVQVLHPPRVEQVRTTLEPPSYTRLPPPPVRDGGSIEALVGSKCQFDVTATTAVTAARIKFLESGQDLPLEPIEMTDDAGTRTAYRGSFQITRSDRYQIELVGTEGLRNPNPGTYQIVATPDHPPVAKILSPLDDALNVTLPDGMIPVRISGKDDYGLMSIRLSLTGQEKIQPIEFDMFTAAAGSEPTRQAMAMEFIDLATAQFKDHAKIGQSIVISGTLRDNREPEPMEKTVGPRQVRVIGETDMLRRVSAHFRRIREDVDQNLKLLTDRSDRLSDVLDSLDAGVPLEKQQLPIAYIEVAQGRMRAAASGIHRELMRAFDFHLFNRQEPSAHAATVLQLYREFHAAQTDTKSFFPAFYRDLEARRKDGRLGEMAKILDPILSMTQAADRIAEIHGPPCLKLLARARAAAGNKEATTALTEARKLQLRMIEEFKLLLNNLVRWNEFQDVITTARTLLDQQREIQSRTKTLEGKKK